LHCSEFAIWIEIAIVSIGCNARSRLDEEEAHAGTQGHVWRSQGGAAEFHAAKTTLCYGDKCGRHQSRPRPISRIK
jgi:hypothetical protein